MADGGKLAVRAAAAVWLVVIMIVMWLPDPAFGGLDLRAPAVQGGCFAAGAVLLALADRRRPPLLRDGGCRRLDYLVIYAKRHLVRVAALLTLYAAILELGQIFAPARSFRLLQLAQNIGWVLAACAVVYWLARVLLVGPALGRITEGHLRQVGIAYHREAAYAAVLRDHAQAAYAVCLDPSLAAETKLARVRELLDRALGTELPNPEEEVLDTVFGPRQPDHSRPAPAAARTAAAATTQPNR
jgi:hypothetical protein